MALRDNMVSWWELNEESGTRVDAHGSNDLTAGGTGGVGFGTGKQGNAADFEAGDTDYLAITDASQSGLDFSTTFSVSAWIKLESAHNGAIISKDADDSAATRGYMFWSDSGVLKALVGGGSGTFDFYQSSSSLSTGTWYHVVLTCNTSNASATTFEFFVNGSSIGNGSAIISNNITSIQNNATVFNIGSKNSGAGLSFDGLIDEVGVWSKVLSGTEITDLYNSGNGLTYAGTGSASGPANVKTWNGITAANTKTVNGIAIASVKSGNGIL